MFQPNPIQPARMPKQLPPKRRTPLLAGLFLLGLLAGVVLDHLLFTAIPAAASKPEVRSNEFRLLSEAWTAIRKNYVDQNSVRDRRFTYDSIQGMVDALGDPEHSVFLTPEMRREEDDEMDGEFAGIGVRFESRGRKAVVASLFDNAPAQRSGLKLGDELVSVDRQTAAGMSLEQIQAAVRGAAGSSVTLVVRTPPNAGAHRVTLVREKIGESSVGWAMLPGTRIALVKISVFSTGTTASLAKALTELARAGARAVLLDLRDNPGGYLDEAVGVASRFLRAGDVVMEKDAKGKVTPLPVKPDGVKNFQPLVVLVNHDSASSAEIVAAALQDAGRATLLGEKTMGNGTILTEVPLSDGSSMMLAVEEWLSPKGRVIWRRGVMPDQELAQAPGAELLTPQALAGMTADALARGQDGVLLQGLRLLRERIGAADAGKL
jgi:carboxyl-terminal processing protease